MRLHLLCYVQALPVAEFWTGGVVTSITLKIIVMMMIRRNCSEVQRFRAGLESGSVSRAVLVAARAVAVYFSFMKHAP